MAFTRPYCTLSDVCDETGVKTTDSEGTPVAADKVAKFNRAIDLASREVDNYTRRDFWFHDNTLTPLVVRPEWVADGILYLPFPILTLAGIVQNSVAMAAADFTFSIGNADFSKIENLATINAGGFYGDSSYGGFGMFGGGQGWGYYAKRRLLTITGTFGYSLATKDGGNGQQVPDDQQPPPTIPGPIRRAATLIAAAWSGENRKEFRSAENTTTTVLDENMPKEAIMLLKDYRQKVL